MSKGYEGWLVVAPEPGGWLAGSTNLRGNFLFADSETMHLGKEIKERTNKIVYGRAIKASTRVLGKQAPAGDIEFQFRSDDLPPILLAHFNKYIGSGFGGAGTLTGECLYTFVPEKAVPTFGGSAFGTGAYTAGAGNVFTVSVIKKFFDTTQNGGTNAMWFKSCIVDEVMITCAANDDAKIKASFKAGTVDEGTKLGTLLNPNSSMGSYSSLSSFNSWAVNITWGGGTLAVNKMDITSKNALEERLVLGTINPADYRYGRYTVEGVMDIDMPYDGLKYAGTMLGGSTFSVVGTFLNSASDYVTFSMPNCRLKAFDPDIKGGDSTVTYGLPFVGYESEDGLTAPITVTVRTNTYGSTPVTRI